MEKQSSHLQQQQQQYYHLGTFVWELFVLAFSKILSAGLSLSVDYFSQCGMSTDSSNANQLNLQLEHLSALLGHSWSIKTRAQREDTGRHWASPVLHLSVYLSVCLSLSFSLSIVDSLILLNTHPSCCHRCCFSSPVHSVIPRLPATPARIWRGHPAGEPQG